MSSMTSPMMNLNNNKIEENNCDSPSGSSTSEPHDEPMNLQPPSFIDQSFFYKLDQLSPDNPLFFMQQQGNSIQQLQHQQHLQQQQQQQQQQLHHHQLQQQQQLTTVSPLLSPPVTNIHSPNGSSHSNFVDPLLPNNNNGNEESNNPTFWSGFNNAIPNLAKNFTDYISGGYPMQQQQQQQQQHIGTTQLTPTDPQSTNNIPGMQIRVLGVPQTGAKSRVETQIKLCIQLVTDDGDKAQWWSHLKLPEHMVAKDKLKRPQILLPANNKATATTVIVDNNNSASIKPEKMLYLSARVICASDPSRKVVTCLGCIQRERKRSQRRKENKIIKEEASSEALGEEDQQKSLAAEEQKVLLFNCSEIVDFSSGDTILPTRITCYCRHHNERLGFCIYFEMQDHTGKQMATGMSPPIMITDDHKSNKIKVGRKRLRTSDIEKPASSSSTASSSGAMLYHQQPRVQHPSSFMPSTINQYQIQPRPSISAQPMTPLDSPMTSTSPLFMSSSNKSDKASSPAPPLTTYTPVPTPIPQQQQQERPLLQRLIPNEGPTFGGVEVTLLGSGFRSGLTCMFGDVAASSTHYWSPNTLVCILPPAVEAGTVVVSFKEHPLVVDSQEVTLFTYYNENDRALMELALQVVGLKMTGKVEDARDIAMRIVQGGSAGSSSDANNNNTQQQQGASSPQQQMSLEKHIIQVLQVMSTFRDVESADVSLTSAQGHTMLHLAAMLGFDQLTKTLLNLQCDVNLTDKNGYTALHYAAWYNHNSVVSVLLSGAADAEISNRWNKKPLDLTTSAQIRNTLWNHEPLIKEQDYSSSEQEEYGYGSSEDIMSADVDTSFAEDESEGDQDDETSVWLTSDDESLHGGPGDWRLQQGEETWLSDDSDTESIHSFTSSSNDDLVHHQVPFEAATGLRYRSNRHNRQPLLITSPPPAIQQPSISTSIKYLNEEEFTSHSADEIMDAEPLHEIPDHILTDYEDNLLNHDNEKEMGWMQRTLSHFQQPTTDSLLQNIKNNMPAKPTELNLKNIADHLLTFPRPAAMIANMSVLFSGDNHSNESKEGAESEQTLAWYMALAYAMGARSLTEEEEAREKQQFSNQRQPYASSSSSSSQVPVMEMQQEAAKKRRDKRLFSFWVPMLCLMVIWLIYQFVSSHPGMVDTIIGISGFRRQYLTIH